MGHASPKNDENKNDGNVNEPNTNSSTGSSKEELKSPNLGAILARRRTSIVEARGGNSTPDSARRSNRISRGDTYCN